jgi:hypothetical protein
MSANQFLESAILWHFIKQVTHGLSCCCVCAVFTAQYVALWHADLSMLAQLLLRVCVILLAYVAPCHRETVCVMAVEA